MIRTNADQVAANLREIRVLIQRKMEHMVSKFAVDTVIHSAVLATPKGDDDSNLETYLTRQAFIGLAPVAGFARGGWRVSINGDHSNRMLADIDGDTVKSDAEEQMFKYTLGDNLVILNITEYVANDNVMGPSLQSGDKSKQASSGIMEPAHNMIFMIQ